MCSTTDWSIMAAIIVIIVSTMLVEPLQCSTASNLKPVEVMSFPYKKSYEEDPTGNAKHTTLEILTIERENELKRNEGKNIGDSRGLADRKHGDEELTDRRVKTLSELTFQGEQSRRQLEKEVNEARLAAARNAEEVRLLAERREIARREADSREEQARIITKAINDAKIAATKKEEEERALANEREKFLRQVILREKEQRDLKRQISEAKIAALNKEREVQALAGVRDESFKEVAAREERQRQIKSEIKSAEFDLARKEEDERVLLEDRERLRKEEEKRKGTLLELDRNYSFESKTNSPTQDKGVNSGFQEVIYPEKALLPVKTSKFATLRSKLSGRDS